ncbi:hypothetical protein Tco_0684627, partial [Tanacetum coccineum]
MYHFQTTHLEVVLSYIVLLIYEVTLPDPYSASTQFGGVTDCGVSDDEPAESTMRHDAPQRLRKSMQPHHLQTYVPWSRAPTITDSLPALSLGYVADSDPKEDPDEDPKKDPKKDPANYPVDGEDEEEEEEESSV